MANNEKVQPGGKVELIWLSVGLAGLAWILDSLMDSLVFHQGTVIEQIIHPEYQELGVRLLFGTIFIAFGIYIQNIIIKLKLTENALEEAVTKVEGEKNKTMAIIEAIGDGIILQDTDFRILYQNQIQNDLQGNHTGEFCYKAYEGRDTICEWCPVELSFRDGNIHKTERNIDNGKGMLWFELTGSPLKDSTGKITGGVKVVRDITQRKKTEESLKLFSYAVEEAPDGVQIVDLSGHIIYSNKAVEGIYGFSPSEYKGKHVDEMNVDHELASSVIIPSIRDTGRWVGDLRVKHKDGHILPIWLTASMIRNSKGEPTAIVGIISDITERKLMEEELRRAHDELELRIQERTAELVKTNETLQAEITERKLAEEKTQEQAALLDKAQDAIYVRDLEQHIIYCNKSAQRLYGWKTEEIKAMNADELLYRSVPPQLSEAKKTAIEKGEWTGELCQITRSGKEIIVESRWTLMLDGAGKPKSILILNTDITDKKKLQLQFLRAQRMQSIGTLASGISHDINNALAPIMLSLELLKEKFTDDESKKLIEILGRSANRGASLMKQIQSFARGVEGERIPLHVGHLIYEIRQIVNETFPKHIEMRTDIPKDLWDISGDSTQLDQVLMNLCVNSRDAMPGGGILHICAENVFIDENFTRINIEAKVGPYIVITVSDTGSGISPEIIDRIFEPFFTTKEPGKGTGLGLSTSLGIVKSHGGFINVYSEVGKGTAFKVYLPVIATSQMQKDEDRQLNLSIGQGELILVVDDEEQVREITRVALEKFGYKVIAANNGAEAVIMYNQASDKIKIILMDMMMPIMDGPESIRELRKANPEVRIIGVSGLTEKDELEGIANTHVNAFLAKPYTTENLLTTVREVLNMK